MKREPGDRRLAGVQGRLDHKAENKPVVAVLIDHSQSMQLPAGPFESEDELRIAEAAGYRSEAAPPTPTRGGR